MKDIDARVRYIYKYQADPSHVFDNRQNKKTELVGAIWIQIGSTRTKVKHRRSMKQRLKIFLRRN